MNYIIDLDGVLYDFMHNFAERWDKATGVDIRPDEPQEYDTLHTRAGVTRDKLWDWYRRHGGFDSVPLIPGMRQTLKTMRNEGITICIATNRPTWAALQTITALGRDNVKFDGFYIGPDKVQLDGDVWIDDNPGVIEAIQVRHSVGAAWMVPQPWNQLWRERIPPNEKIVRIVNGEAYLGTRAHLYNEEGTP